MIEGKSWGEWFPTIRKNRCGFDVQAIEARSAATTGAARKGESAVGDKPMHQDASKVGG